MTVITKAISEKKPGDKLEQPLVVPLSSSSGVANADAEAQHPKNDYVIRKRFFIIGSNHLPHNMTTYCLFLTGLLVILFGIIGGICIYNIYTGEQMHKLRTDWYTIPYDQSFRLEELRQNLLSDSDLLQDFFMDQDFYTMKLQNSFNNKNTNYFQERFEINVDEGYENVDVPDFRGGRQGRFTHDFNINKTGIIDVEGQCCFVMPLNREIVLPPNNMFDLLKKIEDGHYKVDTEVVRKTMKIMVPPITNYSLVGPYIARECQNMSTYLLQPVNKKIHKRSAAFGMYGQYAGKTMELYITNLVSVLNSKN